MLEALGEDDEGAVDEVLGARAGVVVRLGPGSSRDDASVDAGIPRRGGGIIVRVGGGVSSASTGGDGGGSSAAGAPSAGAGDSSVSTAGGASSATISRPNQLTPRFGKTRVSATRFGRVLAAGWFEANFHKSLTDNAVATISLISCGHSRSAQPWAAIDS